jgi:hypothetical protein
MPDPSKKKPLSSLLRQLSRRLLPRAWALRADLRRVDRLYRPLVGRAKGEEREMLIAEHHYERASVEEELEAIQTRRLIRQARKRYIVAPEVPWSSEYHEDENWERGPASETWHLKPAAVASLQRQIEDANKRRREAWEAWAKILGGLITGLVALVSALVSLILAQRR